MGAIMVGTLVTAWTLKTDLHSFHELAQINFCALRKFLSKNKEFRNFALSLHAEKNKSMEILEYTSIQLILFFVLYGITAAVPLMAAVYLLLWRVETLPNLEIQQTLPGPFTCREGSNYSQGGTVADELSTSLSSRRGAGGGGFFVTLPSKMTDHDKIFKPVDGERT